MTNLDHQDGIMRLARRLKRLGVDDALRERVQLTETMLQSASLSLNLYNNMWVEIDYEKKSVYYRVFWT